MALFAVRFLSIVLLADCAAPADAERDVLLDVATRQGIALSDDELRTLLADKGEVLSAWGAVGAVIRENIVNDRLVEKMRHCMRCAIAERIPRI